MSIQTVNPTTNKAGKSFEDKVFAPEYGTALIRNSPIGLSELNDPF